MFGLACARAVRTTRLSPQAVAFLHAPAAAPFASAPKHQLRLVSVGQLGLGARGARGYATQNDGGKHESKEELLDRLTREARARGRSFDQTHEHVGPFPLGVGPSGRNKTWKRWGDLGLGGKRECPRAAAGRAGPFSRARRVRSPGRLSGVPGVWLAWPPSFVL